jgi:signal transduction histidine kinase
MTRRIVLSVLLLIAAVIGAVAVPLGLLTASQDRHDFTDETTATASTLANVAEERLDDGSSPRALHRLIRQLGRDGDKIGVFDKAGRLVYGTRPAGAVSLGQLAVARGASTPLAYPGDGSLLVVAPVRNDDETGNVGTVALQRPTTTVDHRITVLWWLIGLVAAAGLLAAAIVAFALARWVRRPLGDLERAARVLGDGELRTRAPGGSGPEEVRQLAGNFNVMAARLEALVHGHQATMADVSHQLRTPLSALRLRLELLAQDSDDVVAGELAGAQEEIARLSRLVNGLLAIARAENATTAPVIVDVDAVIASRITAWRPAADEQEVALIADQLAAVQARIGDGQLEQILDNLLANALDALGPGCSIRLGCRLVSGRAQITVADDGPGMTMTQMRAAFRRFATSSSGGSGLGLAIVDRLAVSAGGSAALSDTPGGGLTVTLELPAPVPERASRARNPRPTAR